MRVSEGSYSDKRQKKKMRSPSNFESSEYAAVFVTRWEKQYGPNGGTAVQ